MPLEAVSLQGHSVEDGESRPAHKENQSPQAQGAVFEVTASSPFSVSVGAVNDLCELRWSKVIRRNG